MPGDGGALDAAPDARGIDASPPDASIGVVAAPDPCPPMACGPPHIVTTDAELLAILDDAPSWPMTSEQSSGCIAPTREIEVRGTVTLDSASVSMPALCETAPCFPLQLVLRTPGAECFATDAGTGCPRAQIIDTTVRLLRLVTVNHPFSLSPRIEILASCAATTCGPDERLCEANAVCWLDVPMTLPYGRRSREHCKHCLGQPHQRCACWDGERPLPDGTPCSIWIGTGSAPSFGTCAAGLCVR